MNRTTIPITQVPDLLRNRHNGHENSAHDSHLRYSCKWSGKSTAKYRRLYVYVFIARRYAVQHYVRNCQSVCPTVRVCRTRLAKILALISGRFAFGQQSWASCSHTDDSSATKQCKLVPVKAQRCTAAGKVTVHRTSHWLICVTYYTYGVSGRSKNWKIGGKRNVPSLLPVLSLTRPFPAANAKRPP